MSTTKEIKDFLFFVKENDGGLDILSAMITVAEQRGLDLSDCGESEDFKSGMGFGLDVARELLATGKFTFKEKNGATTGSNATV